MQQQTLVTISDLSEATGVNSVTLRAWERRYGLLKPQRDSKGHRLYTATDIERVEKILNYIAQGISVGKIKRLLDSQNDVVVQQALGQSREMWQQYLHNLLEAIAAFSHNRVDAIYNEILSLYPIDTITQRLLLPLMHEFKQDTRKKIPGTLARQQFFTTFIRNKLGSLFSHLATMPHKKHYLLSCLPGEKYELALLLFAIDLLNHGVGVTFLGANMPVDEILYSAEVLNPDAIVLLGKLTPTITETLSDSGLKTIFCFSTSNKNKLVDITLLPEDFHLAREVLNKI